MAEQADLPGGVETRGEGSVEFIRLPVEPGDRAVVGGSSKVWIERARARLGGAGYDFFVEREWLARPAGLALWGTDIRLLFDSIRMVGDLPDDSAVLDIPCGGGLALRGLRRGQRVHYVAADISPDMLARARRRASAMGRGDVQFAKADIERMPFGDNEFDLCLSFNSLHCLPDPAGAIREITRCLAPDGRLVGSAVVRGAGLRRDMAIGALQRSGFFGPGGTADDLRDWLTDAGLRVDRLQRSGAVVHFAATLT
jgi:SAM-dependent methyltransferase